MSQQDVVGALRQHLSTQPVGGTQRQMFAPPHDAFMSTIQNRNAPAQPSMVSPLAGVAGYGNGPLQTVGARPQMFAPPQAAPQRFSQAQRLYAGGGPVQQPRSLFGPAMPFGFGQR